MTTRLLNESTVGEPTIDEPAKQNSAGDNTPATMCTLPEAELGERVGFITQEILSGVSATVELEDGVELHFPGDEIWLRKVTDLIAAERKCCTFLRFELIALPQHGSLLLRIRGDGVKDFLKKAMVAHLPEGFSSQWR